MLWPAAMRGAAGVRHLSSHVGVRVRGAGPFPGSCRLARLRPLRFGTPGLAQAPPQRRAARLALPSMRLRAFAQFHRWSIRAFKVKGKIGDADPGVLLKDLGVLEKDPRTKSRRNLALLVAPDAASWPQMAGYLKAVWRDGCRATDGRVLEGSRAGRSLTKKPGIL